MARPQHRKAAKAYPNHGIEKGEMYWYVKIKTGPYSSRTMRQKQPFKASQLTSSAYLGALADWEDQKNALSSMDDAQQLADDIRALGEEQTGNKDNMPEGLQQGDTGQLLEERAEQCEAAAGEIEAVISDWESAKDEHETNNAAATEEGEDAEEFDEQEFIDRVQEVSVG